MEVNALTRWQSIGQDLFKMGELEDVIEKVMARRSRAREVIQQQQQSGDEDDWTQHLRSSSFHMSPLRNEFPDITIPVEEDSDDDIGNAYISGLLSMPSSERFLEVIRRAIRRFLKGFAVGAAGQGLLTAAKMMLRANKKGHGVGRPPLTDLAFPDVARFGGFVGLFLALFETGMLLPELFPATVSRSRAWSQTRCSCSGVCTCNHRSSPWWLYYLPMLSGGLAASSLALAPVETRVPITLFFGVRAFEIISRLGVSRGVLPSIPHADTILMSLASSQVLWAWFFSYKSLDPGYARFLDHQGGRNTSIVRAYAHWMDGSPIPPAVLRSLNLVRAQAGFEALTGDTTRGGCEVLHPGTRSCSWATVIFFIGAIKRALPVYLPVYVLPLLLFRSSSLLHSPRDSIVRTLRGVAQSSLFLAAFCSTGWTSSCLWRMSGIRSQACAFAAGFASGATVLLEKKPRRIELALYVLTQAIQSTLIVYGQWARKGLPVPSRGPHKFTSVAVFAVAASIIMHCYVRESTALRPGYYSLLHWMIGSGRLRLKEETD